MARVRPAPTDHGEPSIAMPAPESRPASPLRPELPSTTGRTETVLASEPRHEPDAHQPSGADLDGCRATWRSTPSSCSGRWCSRSSTALAEWSGLRDPTPSASTTTSGLLVDPLLHRSFREHRPLAHRRRDGAHDPGPAAGRPAGPTAARQSVLQVEPSTCPSRSRWSSSGRSGPGSTSPTGAS